MRNKWAKRGQARHDGREAAGGFSGREHFSASETKTQSSVAQKRRLSYKEQREFDTLEADLERLNAEKADIEALLSAGTASYEQIRNASERYEALKTELDAKETRWLELSL